MKRKVLSVMLATAMTATLFAGCGSDVPMQTVQTVQMQQQVQQKQEMRKQMQQHQEVVPFII